MYIKVIFHLNILILAEDTISTMKVLKPHFFQ